MMKIQFSNEVTVKNGRIRRSVVPGLKNATPETVTIVKAVKPVLNFWLKAKIGDTKDLFDATFLVKTQCTESSRGLKIEFKLQAVGKIESTSSD